MNEAANFVPRGEKKTITKMGPKDAPIFKGRVLEMVRLREEGKTFNEIGKIMGCSHMNAFYNYRRWRAWAVATEPSIANTAA